MNKILIVAKREYLASVKTKGFLIGTLLLPILFGILFLIPTIAKKLSPTKPKNIVVIDLSGTIYSDFELQVKEMNKWSNEKYNIQHRQVDITKLDSEKKRLNEEVNSGKLDAYLIIGKNLIIDGTDAKYYSNNLTNIDMTSAIKRALNDVVIKKRLVESNLDPNLIANLQRPINLEEIDIGTKGEEKKGMSQATIWTSYAFLMVLAMSSLVIAGQSLTNIIEEKSNRIFEVLLSSMSAFQLMAGKMLGLGLSGLTLIAIWSFFGYSIALYKGLTDIISLSNIGYLFIYFILGFSMIMSIQSAVGSACNTPKDAQSLGAPINLAMILPMASWFSIAKEPNGIFAIVLSYIPLFTPYTMMVRVSVTKVSVLEIIITTALMIITVIFSVWLSARIFRIGILMYGKTPKFRELVKWARYK